MKAINNPLRPSAAAFNGVRGRSALKTIARKRLRAAERALFRREELPMQIEHQGEQRLRRQTLREQASRDVARLLTEITDAIAARALSRQLDADPCPVAGRVLVQHQVVLIEGRRSGPVRVLLARASCSV